MPLTDGAARAPDHAQQRRLDELAPTHVVLPTGTRARIDYRDDNAPCASMRMQEVFGLASTPRIGGGAVPVTFKLLSPAHRPLQVTRDLASFWRNAYVDVRKDMRGRYPRHYWPENPLEAEPTRRAKPRPRRNRATPRRQRPSPSVIGTASRALPRRTVSVMRSPNSCASSMPRSAPNP